MNNLNNIKVMYSHELEIQPEYKEDKEPIILNELQFMLLNILFYGNGLTFTKNALRTGNYEKPEKFIQLITKQNIEIFLTFQYFEGTEKEPSYSTDRFSYFRNNDHSVFYDFISEYDIQKIRQLKLKKIMSL
jgi:hypothetical protein